MYFLLRLLHFIVSLEAIENLRNQFLLLHTLRFQTMLLKMIHYLLLVLVEPSICTKKSISSYQSTVDVIPLGEVRSFPDPGSWASLYPLSCAGDYQSPINLDSQTSNWINLPPLNLINYNTLFNEMTVSNNGYTVLYSLSSKQSLGIHMPYITGGGLSGQFRFVQFHFHWNSSNLEGGSEHSLGSKRYPVELHLVHFNLKYGTFGEAVKYTDGLAVVSILVELSPLDNEALEPVIEQFFSVLENGDESLMKTPIALKRLLPIRTSSFYRYKGSLTTPNCEEVVNWIVFDSPISISKNQVLKFKHLRGELEHLIVNNRPVQPLKQRIVYYRPGNFCKN